MLAFGCLTLHSLDIEGRQAAEGLRALEGGAAGRERRADRRNNEVAASFHRRVSDIHLLA
jgi:hypothetical protein